MSPRPAARICAEHYDRDLIDVFAVQDEITDAIVTAIEPQIYVAENFRSRRKPPNSVDAWAHTALGSVYFPTRRHDDSLAEFELAPG